LTHALHRADAVVADLLAQLADVHINGTVAHEDVVTPHPRVDLLPQEDLARLAHQQCQQLELLLRQLQHLIALGHGDALQVDPDTVGLQHLACRGHRTMRVILGARGEEDDQRLLHARHLPKLPANLHPVHAGHHDIQHHQVGSLLLCRTQRLRAILGGEHGNPFALQVVLQEVQDVLLIIHQQYFPVHLNSVPFVRIALQSDEFRPGAMLPAREVRIIAR